MTECETAQETQQREGVRTKRWLVRVPCTNKNSPSVCPLLYFQFLVLFHTRNDYEFGMGVLLMKIECIKREEVGEIFLAAEMRLLNEPTSTAYFVVLVSMIEHLDTYSIIANKLKMEPELGKAASQMASGNSLPCRAK